MGLLKLSLYIYGLYILFFVIIPIVFNALLVGIVVSVQWIHRSIAKIEFRYIKQLRSAVSDITYYKKLTSIQKKALFKKCPNCNHGYLHVAPSMDSDEDYLWCNNCDLSMDSSGGYTY